ncbi:MAG: hypothetical protein M2R45_04666 [Verrucomicrobia subdivision 3 bacterium]|nr:hypothetical protein [Limisphaerales bacterium]MCS1416588.1 hypothetical protein [Limisphaerales bacterium]
MTTRQLKQFVTPAVKEMVKCVQCLPVLIQPAEIADAALFLSSDASRVLWPDKRF